LSSHIHTGSIKTDLEYRICVRGRREAKQERNQRNDTDFQQMFDGFDDFHISLLFCLFSARLGKIIF
jgi:hypothetical protein